MFAVSKIHVNKHKAHGTKQMLHTQHFLNKIGHVNNRPLNIVYIINKKERKQHLKF